MPTVEEIQEWIAYRDRQDDHIYERYGRPHEADHSSGLATISDDGEVILGTDLLALSNGAVARTESGNFALRKIGADADLRLRALASLWPSVPTSRGSFSPA